MLRASRTAVRLRSLVSRRQLATTTQPASYPKPGEHLHGFTLQRVKHVPEFQLTALQFQHDKTGAEYIHVARDDKNNVFSISFKTNPPDDTGVPHILEHVTLCGSDKFPIRDPFFKMLPRSLSNFMNAFTSSDHTSYPFATTNEQDYKNLMSVYLDATLHPLLKSADFYQEGWRIGPENPRAEGEAAGANKLVFKGVVYNEMKGQMSDANYLYYIRFQDEIFPAIHNSGGDPQKITDLTHEQLKSFHAKNYHPSNSKIFTYGNLPFEDHLERFNQQLASFDAIKPDSEAKGPISLDRGPQKITVTGPADPLLPPDEQYKTSTSWLTGETSDTIETFSLQILTSLLSSGYSSPLYKGLIDAGLGAEWSPNMGFDSSGKIGIFSVGLSGVKAENVPKVREAILQTLKTARANGFEKSKIDGILHRLEISLKHKTAGFGLELMQRLSPGWFNGVDPFTLLEVDSLVNEFRKRYAQGDYLESLLEKYFLNDKTLTFTMEPSATYASDLVAEEDSRLMERINKLKAESSNFSAAEEGLRKRELELLEMQEKAKDQNLECLPSVHIQDVPRMADIKSIRVDKTGDVSTQWREAPTNGLTYFRAISPFQQTLSSDLRMLLPLFNDSIFRLGTKNMTTEQLEDAIKLKTGGISVGYHLHSSPSDVHHVKEGISFSGYALDRNVAEMFDLLRIVIHETDFDSPEAEIKILQLLKSDASGAINSIAEMGHAYARRYANASVTLEGRLSEEYSGLTQVRHVSSLALRSESEGLSDIVQKLKTIQALVIASNPGLRTAITCGHESVDTNRSHLSKFVSSFSPNTPSLNSSLIASPLPDRKTFFSLPYQVYYGGLSVPSVPYTSPKSAAVQVLSQIMTHKHLHHEIREKGGAYGGGATASPLGGTFGFYSYRDPNPINSLAVMRNSATWALEQSFSERDLEEAKLLIFQGVDAPRSVSEEGMTYFLSGITDEMRQKRREQLLDVSIKQVRDAAQMIQTKLSNDEVATVIIGEEKPGFEDWTKGDMGIVKQSAEALE
jgi:Zn-dependent M16 (insulinase) family peptidase